MFTPSVCLAEGWRLGQLCRRMRRTHTKLWPFFCSSDSLYTSSMWHYMDYVWGSWNSPCNIRLANVDIWGDTYSSSVKYSRWQCSCEYCLIMMKQSGWDCMFICVLCILHLAPLLPFSCDVLMHMQHRKPLFTQQQFTVGILMSAPVTAHFINCRLSKHKVHELTVWVPPVLETIYHVILHEFLIDWWVNEIDFILKMSL